MEEIFEKYSNSVIKNLDKDNFRKILIFLENENCDYLEDLIEDYLDLFTIDYEIFVTKYKELNQKYNNKFLELASEDMNMLEEFFN
ncbi:MAG: hypothetical protein IJB71_04435 [Bacilli bacterium]|nr:hypothetical protein [Bacilli bacterium]